MDHPNLCIDISHGWTNGPVELYSPVLIPRLLNIHALAPGGWPQGRRFALQSSLSRPTSTPTSSWADIISASSHTHQITYQAVWIPIQSIFYTCISLNGCRLWKINKLELLVVFEKFKDCVSTSRILLKRTALKWTCLPKIICLFHRWSIVNM